MSGYGPYVWTSYALWFVIVAWNVWSALRMRADARTRALRRTQAAATGSGSRNPDSNELSEEGA